MKAAHETFLDYQLDWSLRDDFWADVKVTDSKGEEYLNGFIKWDGCSEFDIERIHLCGPHNYRDHFSLMRHIYIRAFQLMEREPDEPWDEPTTLWTA